METILKRVENIGIVPVVKITDESQSIPLAQALSKGGIDIMEITFRSEHAISAIKAISKSNPEILLGAGTVSTAQQAADAVAAGANFIVTPGFNHEVVQWCVDNKVLALPGIQTPSEIETALSYGIKNVKFFPAATSGGPQFLKDISGPYAHVRVMPSGGINKNNMHDYLGLKNVVAVGGSFMLPQDKIENHEWQVIEDLSKSAIQALLDLKLVEATLNKSNDDSFLEELNHLVSYEFTSSNEQTLVFETPYIEAAAYQFAKSYDVKHIDSTSFSISDSKNSVIIKQK